MEFCRSQGVETVKLGSLASPLPFGVEKVCVGVLHMCLYVFARVFACVSSQASLSVAPSVSCPALSLRCREGVCPRWRPRYRFSPLASLFRLVLRMGVGVRMRAGLRLCVRQ